MFTIFLGYSLLSLVLDFGLLLSFIFFTEKELFPLVLGEIFLLVPLVSYFIFGVNVLPLILPNLALIGYSFVGFLFGGALWSFFKWWRRTVNMQPEVDREWAKYKKMYPDGTVEQFKDSPVYNPLYRRGVDLSNKHNWAIVNWIMLWPVSMFWTVTRSLTIDLANMLLSIFGTVYNRIAANSFKNLN